MAVKKTLGIDGADGSSLEVSEAVEGLGLVVTLRVPPGHPGEESLVASVTLEKEEAKDFFSSVNRTFRSTPEK